MSKTLFLSLAASTSATFVDDSLVNVKVYHPALDCSTGQFALMNSDPCLYNCNIIMEDFGKLFVSAVEEDNGNLTALVSNSSCNSTDGSTKVQAEANGTCYTNGFVSWLVSVGSFGGCSGSLPTSIMSNSSSSDAPVSSATTEAPGATTATPTSSAQTAPFSIAVLVGSAVLAISQFL